MRWRERKKREDRRSDGGGSESPGGLISIVGRGMTIDGDLDTDGTVRIEGRVTGTVRAGKAVVIGKGGSVDGDVVTLEGIVSGSVTGSVEVESRLELHSTARIDGKVRAERIQLEEGAILNGAVQMGSPKRATPADQGASAGTEPGRDAGDEQGGSTPEGERAGGAIDADALAAGEVSRLASTSSGAVDG